MIYDVKWEGAAAAATLHQLVNRNQTTDLHFLSSPVEPANQYLWNMEAIHKPILLIVALKRELMPNTNLEIYIGSITRPEDGIE